MSFLFRCNARTSDVKAGVTLKIQVKRFIGKQFLGEDLGEWQVTLSTVEIINGERMIGFTYDGTAYVARWKSLRRLGTSYAGRLISKGGKPLD